MGVLQRSVNHSVIGRAIAGRTLQERNPQLLKLPLPLPSVPVLSPLLSPLVGGSNDNSNPAPTTTKATPPPAQTSPSSSGGSSGGSSGNGNSGSGGNSGSTSGSGDSGSSPPSSGNSGSSGSGSSSSPPPSTGSSSSSSSSGAPPSDDSPSPSEGNGSSGSSASASTPSGTAGSTSTSSTGSGIDDQSSSIGGSSVLSSASGNSSDPSSVGGVPVVANAGSIPGSDSEGGSSSGSPDSSGSPGSSGTHSTGTSVVVGASSPSSSQGSSGGTGPAAVGGSGTAAAQQGGKHGLSGGAIAAIVMVLLFVLVATLVFFVRKRTRSQRNERANKWWFSRKRNSQTYGDRDSKEFGVGIGAGSGGTRSARSSFATTVDHSTRPRRSSEFIIPPLPPMAEVGRANGAAPTLVLDTSFFASANANGQQADPRFSIGSHNSNTSENSTTQYLVVDRQNNLLNPELGTPMSVRPFSPSESFAFPRPPDPAGDRTSAYSRLSNGTLAAAASKSSPTIASFHLSGEIPPTPALPSRAVSSTPINATPVNSDPFADNNPFDDPAAAISNASTGEFAEVEYIRRPFYPTLPDELAVQPDECVKVLQAFDDGWALVEKVDAKGKGKEGTPGEQGLIPVDCLREPGQDLTTFIASKRLSSYAGSVNGATTAI